MTGHVDTPEHVVFVIDNINYGGAQQLLVPLTAALRRRGTRVAVCALQPGNGLEQRLREAGADLVLCRRPRPSIINPLKLVSYIFNNIRDIRRLIRERPDCVVHSHLSDAEFLGTAAGLLGGARRILVTVHVQHLLPQRRWFDPRNHLRVLVTRFLFSRTNGVIAVSEATAETLRRDLKVPGDKVFVVRNGIDTVACDVPRPSGLRHELGLSEAAVVFVNISRLAQEKNHALAIKALAELGLPRERAMLLLVGDGETREELERLSRELGVEDRVVFAGYRDDVPQLLAISDCYALSSLYEGTSLALLEAMAASRAVISTDIEGNRALLIDERNCLLVPNDHVLEYSRAMKRIIADPELRGRLGAQAKQDVLEQYSIDVMVDSYAGLWGPRSLADPAKPRVAVIGMRGIPASWGGVERQCEELYTRLAAMGFPVDVYARKNYVTEDITEYRGVGIVRLGTIDTKHLEAFLHTFLAVLQLTFRRVDIVHIYSQGPALMVPLVRVLKPRAKVFFTCGGLDWQREKWTGAAKSVIHLGEWCSARLTHARVMVSRYLKNYYETTYKVRTDYIPNGVNIPDIAPEADLGAMGLEPGKYICFVGRLVPEKRIQDLIRAYLRTPRSYSLAIVGDAAASGEYVRELKDMCKDTPQVVFTGYLFGDDLHAVLANAKAYATASGLEGLPLTLLEAMSWALPCIASDIEQHSEPLAGVGWYFPVGDLDALAARLDQLEQAQAEELRLVGEACRERVRAGYTWDDAAGQLGELYLRHARGKRGKGC